MRFIIASLGTLVAIGLAAYALVAAFWPSVF